MCDEMSRDGVSDRLPSWTIQIRPPWSTTNSRPLPSRGVAIASGAPGMSTTGSTLTLTSAGAQAPLGDDAVRDATGDATGEAPGDAASGVAARGDDVPAPDPHPLRSAA